jgi:hypothetical protein
MLIMEMFSAALYFVHSKLNGGEGVDLFFELRP